MKTTWVLCSDEGPEAVADNFGRAEDRLLTLYTEARGWDAETIKELRDQGRLGVDLRDNDWWVIFDGIRQKFSMTQVEKID